MNGKRLRVVPLLPTLAVLLGACQQDAPETETLIRPVRYERVVSSGSAQRREFSGVTKAALEADLSFKVPGNITRIRVNVGDTITSNDPVAELDPTDFEVQLREAEAGLELARAEVRNARAAFDRTRELYENRNASKSDLDNARAMSESAGAQLRAAQQQLEAARLQLSYTRLTAPQACSVAQKYVEPNQNVSAGQPIMKVNCGDCAEISVDVPEVFISRVESGSTATVILSAFPGREFVGNVTEIGVAPNRSSATYPVTVALSDECQDIRSGMAATVSMLLRGPADAAGLYVPLVSVGEDRDGNFVYVLVPGEQGRWIASRRRVEVGPPTPDGILILDGLDENELIATAGVRRLNDGQVVTLLGSVN
ncbi:MAG: efflux RND transporter periplasmic adaptor subunit [Gammaproteobacteria bacterium]|nr:efflux RND transporter periplasmic adaptor subunit [Gammaproteobacteria bacterium]